MRRSWIEILLCLIALGALPARADDTEILAEVERVKVAYESEIARVEELIAESIEKRLVLARKAGNKKLVDVIEVELLSFKEFGDIPPATSATLQRKAASLAATVDRAYATAIQQLTKANSATALDTVNAEHTDFQRKLALQRTRSTLLGTWRLDMGGYWSDFTFYPDGTMYHSTEKHTGTWRVNAPKGCIMVFGPGDDRGQDDVTGSDQINLPLDPRGTKGKGSNGGVFTLTKKK